MLIWLDVVSFDAVVVGFAVVVVVVAFDIVVPLALVANIVEVLWSGVLDAADSVARVEVCVVLVIEGL